MIALAQPRPADRPAGQTKFLAMLPVITRYAGLAFRSLNAEAREEAMAEVMAKAFVAYARLAELDKTDIAYPTVLAVYGIRQYWDGRRVGTKANGKDVYARTRHKVRREYLGTPGDQRWRESLIDNSRSPVPDQAAFRIDFPQWLQKLPDRDRDIVHRLSQGDPAVEVARKHRITRGRVSQLRRELHDGWLRFHGELPSGDRLKSVADSSENIGSWPAEWASVSADVLGVLSPETLKKLLQKTEHYRNGPWAQLHQALLQLNAE